MHIFTKTMYRMAVRMRSSISLGFFISQSYLDFGHSDLAALKVYDLYALVFVEILQRLVLVLVGNVTADLKECHWFSGDNAVGIDFDAYVEVVWIVHGHGKRFVSR